MRSLVLAAAVLLPPAVLQAPAGAATEMSAAQIRSMPLMQRPDRPGHFLGNTLRRMNRAGVVNRAGAVASPRAYTRPARPGRRSIRR